MGNIRSSIVAIAMMCAMWIAPAAVCEGKYQAQDVVMQDTGIATVIQVSHDAVPQPSALTAYAINDGFYWSDRPLAIVDGRAVYAGTSEPFVVDNMQLRSDTPARYEARTLCEHCRTKYNTPKHLLEAANPVHGSEYARDCVIDRDAAWAIPLRV